MHYKLSGVGSPLRIWLKFSSSLVEDKFRVYLFSQVEVNSGLFSRPERAKMPKRNSNKLKSNLNILICDKF